MKTAKTVTDEPRLMLSCLENGFEANLGSSSMVIDALIVDSASNWKYPHRVTGRGGASMMLTDNQLLQLVSEYLRYRLASGDDSQPSYTSKSVGFNFICSKRTSE